MSYLLTENYARDLERRMLSHARDIEIYQHAYLGSLQEQRILKEEKTKDKTKAEAEQLVKEMEAFQQMMGNISAAFAKYPKVEVDGKEVDFGDWFKQNVLSHIAAEIQKISPKLQKIAKNGIGFLRNNILGMLFKTPVQEAQLLMYASTNMIQNLKTLFKGIEDLNATGALEEDSGYKKLIDGFVKGTKKRWADLFQARGPATGSFLEADVYPLVNKKADVKEMAAIIGKTTGEDFKAFNQEFQSAEGGNTDKMEKELQDTQEEGEDQGGGIMDAIKNFFAKEYKADDKTTEQSSAAFKTDDPAEALKILQQAAGNIDKDFGSLIGKLPPDVIKQIIGGENKDQRDKGFEALTKQLAELQAGQEEIGKFLASLQAASPEGSDTAEGGDAGRLDDEVFDSLAQALASNDNDSINPQNARDFIGKQWDKGRIPKKKEDDQESKGGDQSQEAEGEQEQLAANRARPGKRIDEKRIHRNNLASLLFEEEVPFDKFAQSMLQDLPKYEKDYEDPDKAEPVLAALGNAINKARADGAPLGQVNDIPDSAASETEETEGAGNPEDTVGSLGDLEDVIPPEEELEDGDNQETFVQSVKGWFSRMKDAAGEKITAIATKMEEKFDAATDAAQYLEIIGQMKKEIEQLKQEKDIDNEEWEAISKITNNVVEELKKRLTAAEGERDELSAAAAEQLQAFTDLAGEVESDEARDWKQIISKMAQTAKLDDESIKKLESAYEMDASAREAALEEALAAAGDQEAAAQALETANSELEKLLGDEKSAGAALRTELAEMMDELKEKEAAIATLPDKVKQEIIDGMGDEVQSWEDFEAYVQKGEEAREMAALWEEELAAKDADIATAADELEKLKAQIAALEAPEEEKQKAGIIMGTSKVLQDFWKHFLDALAKDNFKVGQRPSQAFFSKTKYQKKPEAEQLGTALNYASGQVANKAVFKGIGMQDEAKWHKGDLIVERWAKLAGIK